MKEFCRKIGTVTRTLPVLNVNRRLFLLEDNAPSEKTRDIVSGVMAG